ncbi:MAG: hypothetical protein IJA39_05050, partial [Clostridia bacterium]|nr:hypothetical protein [Clostridia bacterium]
MKNTFKQSIAAILAILMLLMTAPLADFGYICFPLHSVGFAADSKEITAYGITEDGLSWTVYNNGALVISGEGEMQDYFEEKEEILSENITELSVSSEENAEDSTDLFNFYSKITPWADYRHEITSVTVENGITRVGRNAFFLLYKTETVSLPDTLVTIGSGA